MSGPLATPRRSARARHRRKAADRRRRLADLRPPRRASKRSWSSRSSRRPAPRPPGAAFRGERSRDGPAAGAHGRDQDPERLPGNPDVDGQLADRVAVGIDHERPIGADLHLLAADEAEVRIVHVRAVEELGEAAQEVQLRRRAREHHVEEPVVQLGVRDHEHASPVGLRVRDDHRVAGDLMALSVNRHLEGAVLPGPGKGYPEFLSRPVINGLGRICSAGIDESWCWANS